MSKGVKIVIACALCAEKLEMSENEYRYQVALEPECDGYFYCPDCKKEITNSVLESALPQDDQSLLLPPGRTMDGRDGRTKGKQCLVDLK